MKKRKGMKRLGMLAVLFSCLVGAVVMADMVAVDFESPTYTLGTVNGQDGWVSTGSVPPGGFDHAVSSVNSGPPSFGGQSLRLSNAVTSGSFGDQTFSKPLVDEAGEGAASNAGLSSGTRQPHFDTQFDFVSVVPTAEQPGLHFSFSPDRGDGARMSYLRVEDNPGGVDVFFIDVQGTIPWGEMDCNNVQVLPCGNFVETRVATALDRTVPHTLALSVDFHEGTGNDVVRVYVDGALVHTGTTWEDYYAFDPESSDGLPSRTVDSVLFRTSGASAPDTLGNGFFIDNLKTSSGPIPVGTTTVHKTVDAGGSSPTSFCFTLSPATANGQVCANGAGNAVFNNVPVGTYSATETSSPATYHQVSNNCTGLVIAAQGDSRTCDVHDTFNPIAHDVDANLSTGKDIVLGTGTIGTKVTDVKAECKNETPAENVRCTVQVSGLPAQCTVQSSGPDKLFGTGDDGAIIAGPGGGFLLNNTSFYAVNQTKHFDFKLKTTCNPNLAKGVTVTLQFKGCADGGFVGADPCQDLDLTPDKSPNVVVKSVKLHR